MRSKFGVWTERSPAMLANGQDQSSAIARSMFGREGAADARTLRRLAAEAAVDVIDVRNCLRDAITNQLTRSFPSVPTPCGTRFEKPVLSRRDLPRLYPQYRTPFR